MDSVIDQTSSSEDIRSAKEECEYSTHPLNELDPLDLLIYYRREYDI